MYRLILLMITALLLAACGTPTPTTSVAPIRVIEPWARAMASGAPAMGHGEQNATAAPAMGQGGEMAGANSAIYMRIDNSGPADRLISAASDVADAVEIHETTMEDNVMRMRPVTAIELPANGSVELKPGSLHVMLLGLRRDLKPGETISMTLTFEQAGELSVTVPVREP